MSAKLRVSSLNGLGKTAVTKSRNNKKKKKKNNNNNPNENNRVSVTTSLEPLNIAAMAAIPGVQAISGKPWHVLKSVIDR